jgi:hypothetical protein
MRVITLPSGRQVTIGDYVKSWRFLKTLPPEKQINGWSHFPETAAWILSAIRFGVMDRINIRAGVELGRDMSAARVNRNLLRTVKTCECRWCGSVIDGYKPHHARFCDQSCSRSYWS